MEITVFLQLMENYEGLVLLTNLKKSIDKAFERRLSFKVNFPSRAGTANRLGQLYTDKRTGEPDIDHWVLARSFELSGGSIKNAMCAPYRCAAAAIGMDDLVDAAKYECAAAGKLYRMYSNDDF